MVSPSLTFLGTLLVIVGIVVTFVAVVLLAILGSKSRTGSRSAGVVLIGPIPIIFGTDKKSVKALIVLSILLTLIVAALMLIPAVLR